MNKTISFPKALGLAVLLIGLTGCGDIVGDIQRGLDDAAKQIQEAAKKEAIEQIIKQADENYGSATRVQPGTEVILEIEDEESPIFGAKIIIPADAVPSSVTDAVLAMYHIPEFTLPSDYLLDGPAVEIRLEDMTLQNIGKSITLESDATIFVPYSPKLVTDTSALQLGHMTKLVPPEVEAKDGFELHADTTLVSGKTRTFSPFFAMSAAPEYLFTYKVTDSNNDVVCEQRMVGSVEIVSNETGPDAATLFVEVFAGSTSVYLFAMDYDDSDPISKSSAASEVHQEISCEGVDVIETDNTVTTSPISVSSLDGSGDVDLSATFGDANHEATVTLKGTISGITRIPAL